MKKPTYITVCLYAIILSGVVPIFAQNTVDQRVEMIDLKMNLAETKLELLDSKVLLWEEKPALLELKLRDLENSIMQLSFSPEQFNEKFLLLESLIEEQQSRMKEQSEIMELLPEMIKKIESETQANPVREDVIIPPDKYIISIHPIRLFEGTLQLSIERALNRGNSIELSAMATYATKEGMANYYLSNQRLTYYNADLAEYTSYDSENISGFGGSLAWRNYLLPRTRPNYPVLKGPYVAPNIMYRRLNLSGFDQEYNEEEDRIEMIEVVQNLNVYSGGFIAGWQFVLWKAITADVYVGGMIRLSKYDGDSGFTKYKQLKNIDFSGVMPNFGVKIGVVK
ncbi:hypothetical protein ACFLTA_04195 [Bacteroidota bacterium]